MPLEIIKRQYQYVPDIGQPKYAHDPEAASIPGVGNFTTREKQLLYTFRTRGMLRYRDFEGYYCQACAYVYNVKCPVCGVHSTRAHLRPEEDIFVTDNPAEYDTFHGIVWVKVHCRKCDFTFRVMRH